MEPSLDRVRSGSSAVREALLSLTQGESATKKKKASVTVLLPERTRPYVYIVVMYVSIMP